MDIRQEQGKEMVVSRFNREKSEWDQLGAREMVNFALPPADAAVFRFATKPGAEIVKEPSVEWHPATNFTEALKLPAVGVKKDIKPAIYSTPTARTADNKPKTLALPKGAKAFGKDFYLSVKQGEALGAVYPLDKKTDVVIFSNHNAIAWQGMVIVLHQAKDNPVIMSQFEKGKWLKLGPWGDVNFALAPKAYSIFKFERPGAPKPPAPKK